VLENSLWTCCCKQSNKSNEHSLQNDQEPDDLKVEEEISEDNLDNHGDSAMEESKVDPDYTKLQ
jgi:hypothetical protein